MQEVVAPDGRHIPQGLLVVLSNRARMNRQSGGLGQVGPDGTFRLAAVPAGDYDVKLASAGPEDDLYVSNIRRGDDNVLADGLCVNGASSDPIEITFKPTGAPSRPSRVCPMASRLQKRASPYYPTRHAMRRWRYMACA